MVDLNEHLKAARKIAREKYGDNYSDEMRRRARLSHKAQLAKYGGKKGMKAEMARRRSMRGTKPDAEVDKVMKGEDNE